MLDELGERVLAAIYFENHGNPLQRMDAICDPSAEAMVWWTLVRKLYGYDARS